jgi:predicted amidophosphoribosyltransferase
MDIAQGLLELIAPTRCAGCELPGVLVCDECRDGLPRIHQPAACRRCGAPDGIEACAECDGVALAFSRAACAALLALPLSRVVTVYKDGGERRLAGPLAEIALPALEHSIGDDAAVDVARLGPGAPPIEWTLVPVPASRRAVARRGFDHVERLARELATASGMHLTRVLERRGGRDQRGLGREQRRTNVAGVFRALEAEDVPRRALLVDDVITTGATLDSAARTLLVAGSEEVRVIALARALGVCPGPTAPATLGDASTRLWLRTRERPSPG